MFVRWHGRSLAHLVLAAALLALACSPAAPAASPAAPTSAPTTAAAPKPTTAPAPAASATAAPAAAPSPAAAASPATATLPAPKPERTSARFILATNKDATNVHDALAFQILEQQYGVKPQVDVISGAGEAIKAAIADQADFALATYAAGILAVGEGQQVQVVVPSTFAPYFVLMVDDSIKDWKDFEGKTVGMTATNDSSYFTTVLLLKNHGVDPAKVNWVTVRGTAARAQALVAGKINAGQVLASQSIELAAQPNLRTFAAPGKEFPNLLFNGYWVRKEFAEKNPELVQAVAEAFLLAHRQVQDEARYAAVAPSWAPDIEPDLLHQSYGILRDLQIWDPNFTRWNTDAGEYTARTMAEYQAVEKYVPFPDWATTRFVDRARQRLGEYQP